MDNTVLFIENDQDTVAKAAKALEAVGYSVVSADTAEEGTAKATEIIPSLILINLATPGANGLELCKSLHNTEGLTEVPILLLTLREGKFEPVYTKLYGIVSFLKKPFDNDELIALAQEHAPVTEVEEPEAGPEAADDTMVMGAGDEPEAGPEPLEEDETMVMAGGEPDEEGFGEMSMAGDDEEGEGVFSIDEAEESLDDLQSSFQEPMGDEATAAEEDEFEGTQQFSLEDSEGTDIPTSPLDEVDSGEEDSGGDWGDLDTGDSEGEEDAGGDWGDLDTGDSADSAGEAAGDEDMDDADSTLKMDLAQSGWGDMDIDDSSDTMQMDTAGGAGDEKPAAEGPGGDEFGDMEEDLGDAFGSDDSMQADDQASTGGMEEEPMAEETPAFDDEPMGDDETFMDDSMAGDDDLPQMDMDAEEDYSELFGDEDEGAGEDTGKGKKKKKKKKGKKKKAAKAGDKSPLKRILVLVLLLLVLGGGGFAAYTFFLAEESTTKVTVTREAPTERAALSPDEEPPADMLKELEQEEPVAETGAPSPEPEVVKEKAVEPKPAVKKKKSKPAATASSTAGAVAGSYYVQFGAFGVKDNAYRLVSRLERDGLKAMLDAKKTSSGKTVNYVLLDESFSSNAKATRRGAQIKSSKGYDTAVYRKK